MSVCSRKLPSSAVFHCISQHFIVTSNILLTWFKLELQFFFHFTKFRFVLSKKNILMFYLFNKNIFFKPSTHPLRQLLLNNACPYRISAAAGTALARTSFLDSCHYLPRRNGFTANWAVFTNLILLDQAFAHCPKFPTAASQMELGPCLSPNVAVRSLKPATNHGLGKPLLHQLPNSTSHHLLAINLF